jgi:GSH-dependent disulfide-bond oxidoreductase
MIDLHYCATPNGQKITIMLEEMGADYRVTAYDIFHGDQLTAEFGQINPNFKLPALVDHAPSGGGAAITVFESGAMLQYLAEKCGKFLAPSGAERASTLSWLTWQVSAMGPMGGQASHFMRYAPAGQDYAIARYAKEVGRLLTVMEKRLEKSAYMAGDDYSIADIALWPCRATGFFMQAGGESKGAEEWPATYDWYQRIRARPAVVTAMTRPDLVAPEKYLGRHQKLSDDEWSNMFGDANHAAVKQG